MKKTFILFFLLLLKLGISVIFPINKIIGKPFFASTENRKEFMSPIVHTPKVGNFSARSIAKNFKYFLHYAMAGAVSCSLAHSAMVPLDVVKTRVF
jgi:hypothetical protein